MKALNSCEQPSLINRVVEYANNRGEFQIVALIKRKTHNAALTIIQDVILDYARRGCWLPIRRIERSFDLGILHVWRVALDEVCEEGIFNRGKHTLELLKEFLDCTEVRDDVGAVSRKLTIEYLFDIVLNEILSNDYRIPTNKTLWLELLPLFHKDEILLDYFINNWRSINQNRINDLIDGILVYVEKSKVSTIRQESAEGQLIRHLWRTFNLQLNVSPSQQIQFAKILKPVIQFYRPGRFTQINHVDMNFVYERAKKAVEETVRQAHLIVDLENKIKTEFVKSNGEITFNRFTISDDGDLKEILFHLHDHEAKSSDLEVKKMSISYKFQHIFTSIKCWTMENGLELKDVVILANGSLRNGVNDIPIELKYKL